MDSETPERRSNQSRIYWIIGLAVVILLVVTRCGPEKPVAAYGWNQKMTLVVETAEGTYTGSAVQEMAYLYWACKGLRRMAPDCGAGAHYMQGEAPFVELPDGSVVVATLDRYSLIFDVSQKAEGRDSVRGRYLQQLIDTPGYVVTYTAPSIGPTIWVFPEPNVDEPRFVLLHEDFGRDAEPILSAQVTIETTLEARSPFELETVFPWLKVKREEDGVWRYTRGKPPYLPRESIIEDQPWPSRYRHSIEYSTS